jgi:phospholipid/cholesterol/gamma-HCH transport system permease protein
VAGEPLLKSTVEGERLALAAAGSWTSDRARELEPLVDKLSRRVSAIRTVNIDMRAVERLDTFGAWFVERLVRAWRERGCETSVTGLSDDFRKLVEEVHQVEAPTRAPARGNVLLSSLDLVGRTTTELYYDAIRICHMLGAVVTALGRVVIRPRMFRLTSMVHHLDGVGWRAVPIILLITFLIGAIVAQQGIFHFRKFGADIFVVDMVGILVMRELGVLIVAIMVAGRSGSAYTAELGSMKMREEIDALRTMGFDPVEVLILPRLLALIIAVPLLTFIGSMSALYGGGLVAWLYGGIQPDVFISRLQEAISLDHFQVGIIKAPFMAAVVGIVAFVEGLQVKGSAESLGRQTTSSVVKAIFLVIVLDGVFAMFFASIGM